MFEKFPEIPTAGNSHGIFYFLKSWDFLQALETLQEKSKKQKFPRPISQRHGIFCNLLKYKANPISHRPPLRGEIPAGISPLVSRYPVGPRVVEF